MRVTREILQMMIDETVNEEVLQMMANLRSFSVQELSGLAFYLLVLQLARISAVFFQ